MTLSCDSTVHTRTMNDKNNEALHEISDLMKEVGTVMLLFGL